MAMLTLNPQFNHFYVSDLSVVSNDGIPSAVYYTAPVTCTSPNSDATAILCDPPHRVRRSSSIGGLSDDALDLFPPTEQDEEEIREVEEYVEMLAWLEMLEETHGRFPEWGQLHKRWEERRKEKVVPRPASKGRMKVHHASGSSSLLVTDIIRGLSMPQKDPFVKGGQRRSPGKGERKRRSGRQYASKNRVYQPMK